MSSWSLWRSICSMQARVHNQSRMPQQQSLCQSEMCWPLSRSLWNLCFLFSPESQSFMHLWPRIYWRPIQILHKNNNSTCSYRSHQSMLSISMRFKCSLQWKKQSSLMSMYSWLLWRSLCSMQTRVCCQLWLSIKQSMSTTSLHWPMSRNLWSECQLQSSEPYSHLHL